MRSDSALQRSVLGCTESQSKLGALISAVVSGCAVVGYKQNLKKIKASREYFCVTLLLVGCRYMCVLKTKTEIPVKSSSLLPLGEYIFCIFLICSFDLLLPYMIQVAKMNGVHLAWEDADAELLN